MVCLSDGGCKGGDGTQNPLMSLMGILRQLTWFQGWPPTRATGGANDYKAASPIWSGVMWSGIAQALTRERLVKRRRWPLFSTKSRSISCSVSRINHYSKQTLQQANRVPSVEANKTIALAENCLDGCRAGYEKDRTSGRSREKCFVRWGPTSAAKAGSLI